jgi:predicted dehydrogenase
MQSWASDAVRAVLEKPILVIGLGSIGRRHAKNLIALGATNVIGCDEGPIGYHEDLKGLQGVYLDLNDALVTTPAAAIICVPTNRHYGAMRWCVDEEIPFFVEKPVAHDLSGRDFLQHECWYYNIPNFVACNFRFTPGLQRVKRLIDDGAIGKVVSARAQFGQYLPDMRPNADHKKIYAANKSMGGGCLLDGIHEFDYLSWLLGPIAEAKAFTARLTDVTVDTEDVAEVILRFESGALGSVHEDYARYRYDRRCEIVGTNGVLKWELVRGEPDWYEECCVEPPWGDDKEECVDAVCYPSWDFSINDMYLAEMQHFLRVCAGEEKSLNTVSDAYRLLETVLNAR